MKTKIIISLLSVALMSASCSVFSKPSPGGMVKTVNGGADWQFSNVIKDSTDTNLSGLQVSKIALDPQNREVVFASGYNSGLFRSDDSGASWTKILSKILVYDFAIHPQDSKTIYVAGFFDAHGKVLKTVDGGASWNQIYNEEGTENPVRNIAVNPGNPAQILIGTSAGTIVQSSDGGLSWKLINSSGDRVNKVLWQNNNIYILLRTKGLLKSSDGGGTFQNLTQTLSSSLNQLAQINNSIAIQSFNQVFVDEVSGNLLYLTTSQGLYKSNDEGKTWQQIRLPVKQNESYARAIAVAKTSSNIVFTSVGATVYKSTDAGNTWQTQDIATNGFINYILIDPALPQIVYGGVYVSP